MPTNRSDKHIDGLVFNTATVALCEAQKAGLVSFDKDLHIVDCTPTADALLPLDSRMDTTLSATTDAHDRKNWTTLLRSVTADRQTLDFKAVKTVARGKTRLLNITLTTIATSDKTNILGGGLIVVDVTDEAARQAELAQAERLTTMGKVAGRAAHELNNPLDGILRYVNLALRMMETQPDKARRYLHHCRDGLLRMVRIVGEMLEFSRSIQSPFEQTSLDTLIDEALAAMAAALEGIDVQVVRQFDGAALPVKSEPMFQVFCNLIKNAADAMDGTGTLVITVSKEARSWRVVFADTGGGFDPAITDEMFKPFFTTKPPGRGSGLGLAICRDILEKLNGRITARNRNGGSEFIVETEPL